MNKYVIIVAGGKGLRMGSSVPKQFLELNGKAIVLHTIEKFKKALPSAELFLVLPKTEIPRWEQISKGTTFENLAIAEGGENRFESVKSGLALLSGNGIVGIHDSVRPFVSEQVIQSAFSEAEKTGAAIPIIELKDSLRKLEEDGSKAVDRAQYKIVQTPQCFHTKIVKKAYQQAYQEYFTDDASVVEESGVKVSLVKGNNSNIKITTLEDLKLASFILDDEHS